MTKKYWKEVYGIQLSQEYQTGKSGFIVETSYTNYTEVQNIIKDLRDTCKSTFSVGLQPGYQAITFRFFDLEDKERFISKLKK